MLSFAMTCFFSVGCKYSARRFFCSGNVSAEDTLAQKSRQRLEVCAHSSPWPSVPFSSSLSHTHVEWDSSIYPSSMFLCSLSIFFSSALFIFPPASLFACLRIAGVSSCFTSLHLVPIAVSARFHPELSVRLLMTFALLMC